MAWLSKIYNSSNEELCLWRDYYSHLPHKSIYHFPNYIKILENYFGGQAELFVFGDKKNFVYYPYLKQSLNDLPISNTFEPALDGYYDIVSSWYYGGPLVKSKDSAEILFSQFLDAFGKYAANSGIVSEFIRFDANLKNHSLYPAQHIEFNRETVFVDLVQKDGGIWNDFSTACRRAIRQAQRHNFRIRESGRGDRESWIKFHQVYQAEMQRKNAPKHLQFPLPFFVELKEELDNNVVLLTVEKEEEFCGGFIIVFEDEFAFHFLSATLPDYWPARVNNLLYYHAIMWAKQKGCSTFDFMGGRPGVFRFKCNFSSSRRQFYVGKLVHNRELFDEICQLTGSIEIPAFPPYRWRSD